MHDWNDERCGLILRNVRSIADKDTKLVIMELALTRACREENDSVRRMHGTNELDEAPQPLLGNWGTANGLAYAADIAVSLHFIEHGSTIATYSLHFFFRCFVPSMRPSAPCSRLISSLH